ncbi:MAG: hypothetical protein R8G66_01775 [Cytophagales bacterium]|nr:hypothetical protein [Cytophagales bacterium]
MDKKFRHYINLEDNESFQLVYTSQLYGTFFAVYARFNWTESRPPTSEGEKKKYIIQSIDFEVINYKGLINIGIVEVLIPTEFLAQLDERLNADKKGTVKAFNLVMRGMGGSKHSDRSNPRTEVSWPGPDREPLNLEIASDDLIYFKRTIERLHSDGTPEENGLFDDEFWYREGTKDTIEKRKPIPELEMPSASTFNFDSGPLCPESKNRVI